MYLYLFEIASLFICVHIEMKSETMLEWKSYDSMIPYCKVSLFIYFVFLIKFYTIYVYINLLLHYIIIQKLQLFVKKIKYTTFQKITISPRNKSPCISHKST